MKPQYIEKRPKNHVETIVISFGECYDIIWCIMPQKGFGVGRPLLTPKHVVSPLADRSQRNRAQQI